MRAGLMPYVPELETDPETDTRPIERSEGLASEIRLRVLDNNLQTDHLSDGKGGILWGRRKRERPGPSGRDRRKTVQLYRNWATHRQRDSWLSWKLRGRVATGGLSEFCVGGRINFRDSVGSIDEIGGFFGRRLRGPAGDLGKNVYPAAVLLGLFMQWQASLSASSGPHLDEGRFPNLDFEMTHYRLIILPFTDGGGSTSHWLGLGSWKPNAPAIGG